MSGPITRMANIAKRPWCWIPPRISIFPGIGKFKTAVVQEEEHLDGVLTQRALNWFGLDKTTNSVYAFGEVSWEINEEGKPIFEGTWRAGELDGDGVAEPGLLMPGTFTVGGRYIFDGSQN